MKKLLAISLFSMVGISPFVSAASEVIIDTSRGYIKPGCSWIVRFQGYGYKHSTLTCSNSTVLSKGEYNASFFGGTSYCLISGAASGHALQNGSGTVVSEIRLNGRKTCSGVSFKLTKL